MEGAPGRQRRRRTAGGLLALAAALLAGCGDGRAGRRVDYADALFDVADGGELRRDLKPYSCGEETHLSKLYARPLELERRHDGPAELIVSACAPMTSLHAVRRGDWKLLLAAPEHPQALDDLEADAAERRDRLAEQVEEAARLRDLLGRFEVAARRRSGEIGPGEPAGLESEEIAQLRALGYLP